VVMLHKLSTEKWREVYKMHKTARTGGERAVEVMGKKEKAQNSCFALEFCGEVKVVQNRTWRDRLRPSA